jgi:hypothetical protein
LVPYLRSSLLQPLDVGIGQQGAHLGDGDLVELEEVFRGGKALANEHGVEAFEVGEDDELLEGCVVADVALGFGMGVAPLLGGLAEEGDVEQVGLAGVNEVGLGLGDSGRDKRLFDGVGVDAVVDLGQRPLEVPAGLQAVVLLVLEALKFLNQVQLEFDGDPGGEFEGDVLMGVGTAVAASTGNRPCGAGRIKSNV